MKKGKKMFSIVLVIALVISMYGSLALAAEYRFNRDERIVAGSIGAAWYIIATTFFELFTEKIAGLSFSITPGGGVANPTSLEIGRANFGFSFGPNLLASLHGLEPYDEPHTSLRGMVNLNYGAALHFVVLKEVADRYGLETARDVVDQQLGLRLSSGPRGTGGEEHARRTLEALGAGYNELISWGGSITFAHLPEAMDRLKDGHIDGFIWDCRVGEPQIVDLTLSRDVVFLRMDEEHIAAMVENYGYISGEIPVGDYYGQTEAIPASMQTAMFIVREDVPEDYVYTLTKLVFENRDRLAMVYPLLESLDPVAGAQFPIPLHPGAEAYYKEIGVLD